MKPETFFKFLVKNKIRIILGIIFVVAFLIRLTTVYLVTGWDGIYTADSARYEKAARNLIAGKGFAIEGIAIVSYTVPGYPFFLASTYKVFGYKHWVVRLIHVLIGSFSCLLGYLIGARIFNKAVGLFAACIMAVHPYLSLLTAYLLAETLFTFLLLLTVFWLIKSDQGLSLGYCLAIGICLGIAALTKPLMLAFPAFLFLWAWLNFQNKKVAFKVTFLIVLFMSLTIAPWTYRNYRISGEFIPLCTGIGDNLWEGNNPEVFQNVDKRGMRYFPEKIRIKEDLSGPELDRRYARLAWQFIRENPRQFIILLYYKFLRFWQWGYPSTLRNKIIIFLYGIFFFPFMIAGFFLSFKYSRRSWILHILALYFTTVILIFFASDGTSGIRYRVPLEPYLSIFAAYGALYFMRKYFLNSDLLKFLT